MEYLTRVQLEGEIDLVSEPPTTKIKPITGDPWSDFGFWMEATGFMAYQAMKQKSMNTEEMANYITEYMKKCLNDYTI